jgi:alkylation response protein AidB-like acyl-CoA dehydrogenase
MPRPVLAPPRTSVEEDLLRQSFRSFVDKEVLPHYAGWEKDGCVSRELWLAAGAAGFLGMTVPARYGGGGATSFRPALVLTEELQRAGATGVGFPLHNDVVLPYLVELCTPEQAERWLPGTTTGETITAIAMTEPGAGSDLAGIRTRARLVDGTWVLDGAKTFISNGQLADLVVVVARTGDDPHRGLTLFLVPGDTPGFARGRVLDKIGMKAQDTSELFFDGVRLGPDAVLGEVGGGFTALLRNLPVQGLPEARGVDASAARQPVRR